MNGDAVAEATAKPEAPRLPPRWVIRFIWRGHRLLYRGTAGRLGLRRPRPGKAAGMLRLRTIGRRSGVERAVMLCYFESGASLVTLAMNGWGSDDPAWWLNLQARPDASVDTVHGTRPVRARAATADERRALWPRFADFPGWGDIDSFVAARERPTAVVVLEPR